MKQPATITISVTGVRSGTRRGMLALRRELTSTIKLSHHIVTKKSCAMFTVDDMDADSCVRLVGMLYDKERTFWGVAKLRKLQISGSRDINVLIIRR